MPSPEFNAIYQAMSAQEPRANVSIEELREESEQKAAGRILAPNIKVESIDPKKAGTDCVAMEWVVAPQADRSKVVVYYHGGGYYRGSVNTVREMVSRISAASGWAVLSVGYRIAPENPFPAAVDDAYAGARWLMGQPGISRWATGGDSAGGGLALAVMLRLRDEGKPLPHGAVLMSPWTDMSQSGETYEEKAAIDPFISKEYLDRFAQMYLAGASVEHPWASPLKADLAGLPPLLIQVGTAEVMLGDSRRLAEKAQAAGVSVKLDEWQDMIHVWQNNGPGLPEGVSATHQIGEFLKKLGDS